MPYSITLVHSARWTGPALLQIFPVLGDLLGRGQRFNDFNFDLFDGHGAAPIGCGLFHVELAPLVAGRSRLILLSALVHASSSSGPVLALP